MAWADDDHENDVVRVDEQWELVVLSTDANSTAPQVATTFSPTSDVNGLYAVFELNHQSVPDFASGGLHLQLWKGEFLHATRPYVESHVMRSGAETVSWTQSLKVDEERLTVWVEDGSSTTWGSFGGGDDLKFSTSTSLRNLNGYDSAVSVRHSGVTYAANRVKSLTLKRLRRTMSDGSTVVDETPRVVYEQ
ncbi:MAG: hypothetical protein KDA41_00715 [Planctomycetales bacterium]|nr:hypothetical protein [Planctomycetales bacterium]